MTTADEHEALQALPRPRDLILGQDGRVHIGNVARKFGTTLVDGIACGQIGMRPIGPRERWWRPFEHRTCATCGTDSETLA